MMPPKRAILIFCGLVLLAVTFALAGARSATGPQDPAQLDAGTPAAQGGFRLVGISREDSSGNYTYEEGDTLRRFLARLHLAPPPNEMSQPVPSDPSGAITDGGIGLWVTPPPVALGSANYSATARASTGQQVPLVSGPLIIPPLLFVIPAGYPGTVKYFDVTVTDGQGHAAHWRITHLPPMRHLLTPNTALTPLVTAYGLRLWFHAWRFPQNPNVIGLGAFVSPAPGAAHQPNPGGKPLQRDISFGGMTPEWAPDGYTTSPPETQTAEALPDDGALPKSLSPIWDDFQQLSPASNPYAAQETWVRFAAMVRAFDTSDERVTFHHIRIIRGHLAGGIACYLVSARKPRSLTTPSGIMVTLPAQNLSRVLAGRALSGYGTALYFQMSTDDTRPTVLPKSPLWRRDRKPITAQIIVPSFWGGDGPSVEPGSAPTYTECLSPDNAHVHYPVGDHDFTVVVRQRADIDKTPLTLTLPVEAKVPTTP